ncbi:nitroreductase family protein [Tissierella sp. Yu-01]|uniref:nitroreductase family protein n=1 Tax=Tissierella sp. Yu-01 TaxID=3035694 RepID=UPI00240E851B|nr:nitroreductase family protein [Tissierella sp. Yu-01]WFA09007.1 nitroreductase family protein [Tissierella sp. Yu-01]
MNQVIDVINNRVSLRRYQDKEISKEHLEIILDSAIKAPTAGNQCLYSIIMIKDQKTKDVLSKSCDNQPFIAKAPLILIFAADQQKWFDYYKFKGVKEFSERENLSFEAPQESDLILACEDALIAAQNAVIAAESLGVGSCYIGDILENYEFHKELLNLDDWVFPVTMLCLGYYEEDAKRIHRKRFDKKFIVFEEKYRKLSDDELSEMFSENEKSFVENNKYNADNFAQAFYARKTGAEFSKEMARSVRVALKKWDGRKL